MLVNCEQFETVPLDPEYLESLPVNLIAISFLLLEYLHQDVF